MKQYISEQYYRNVFGEPDTQNEQLTQGTILYYIKRGSSRVDTIVQEALRKGINDGIYQLDIQSNIEVVDAKFPDPSDLAEEIAKIDAVKEAIGIMTKFGIDTGYDFLTGSFSASLGGESYGDTIDFEQSKETMEKQVKELLANFDFSNILIEAEQLKVTPDIEDEDNPAYEVLGDKRPISVQSYKTHHANDHINGGGIIISGNDQTGQVTLQLDPNVVGGDLFVTDDQINETINHIDNTEAMYEGVA